MAWIFLLGRKSGMDKCGQKRAPFVEALEEYARKHMIPFHTPGHKLGHGASAYQQRLFGGALTRDLGLMYALDDLFQPTGPLQEAMVLAADLYGAGQSFFSINGTTACIQAMILAVCGQNEEILIPREAHRSVLAGLILSGARPVYMESRFAEREQVSLGPDMDSLKTAITAHPKAKAVLFTYPTYDGIAGSLREMTAYAHRQGLTVLVDEAHGAHLPFHGALPQEALVCGADCVAQSTHKLAGSLTQTSMLHCRKGYAGIGRIAATMALVQSTSPNYWFLASLDSARRQLALQGTELVGQALALSRHVRDELNKIKGIHSFGREILAYPAVSGLDETKITIDFSALGLTGREAEVLLRAQHIEVEMTAGNHVLALITLGDDKRSAAALVEACRAVAAGRSVNKRPTVSELPLPAPQVAVSPRQAWNAERELLPQSSCVGRIAAETVTFYPPGIPVLALGDIITNDCLTYMQAKLAAGYVPNGAADPTLASLYVLKS